MRHSMKRIPRWPLCLCAVLFACDRPSGEAAPSGGPPEKVVRVRTTRPERGEIVRAITLPGTVRADLEIRLHSRATGFVKAMHRDRGDRVVKGDLIAELDIPEMALELERAGAELRLEEATLKRLESIRVSEKTAVTDQDLDAARARHAVAQASFRRLETLAGYAEVRAPFDGIVTERHVDPGALVREGPVASLKHIDKVRILVDVAEPEVRFVKSGAPAAVRLDALPGKSFTASVARSAGALDPGTRTMRVELEAPNPDADIRPGMYASVVLDLERRAGAITLPAKTVLMEGGKHVVYILSDGRAHRTPVEIGIDDGVRAEVTAGLAGGEDVVLPGRESLVDGMRAEASEAK